MSPSFSPSASTTAAGNRTARLFPHFETCMAHRLDIHRVLSISKLHGDCNRMVDVFSADQAMRWFARIAAGGALGAIAGPLATRVLVKALGLCGLMMLAAGGFG